LGVVRLIGRVLRNMVGLVAWLLSVPM